MKIKAIKIIQPLAEFYLTKMKASELLEISFSEQLQYIDDNGKLKGSQRKINDSRLKEIGRYIDSVEMSFPNSIIIAANYTEQGEITEDKDKRWTLLHLENDLYEINIPSNEKLAVIIDGQHRLFAFNHLQNKERLGIDLPCSIFFDLPNSYQAFLFATINGNQKKVDPSLSVEQFGFNVSEEPKKSWTPEKLAVFITRKLNFSSKLNSPFYNKVKVAPINSFDFKSESTSWFISTATIVQGLLGLISSNPKRDRVEMGQEHIFKGRSRSLLKSIKDSSPLRSYFLEENDDELISIVVNYFETVKVYLWERANPDSYILKTIGIQALFDFLKVILQNESNYQNIDFKKYFVTVSNIDFSDNYFQASGVGKSRIRRVLYHLNNIDILLKEEDIKNIERLNK
jgi:DNA phosphorothioation-associated DGQHR protein 1